MIRVMLVLGLLLPWSVIPDVSGAAPAAAKGAAYKHAYYLFLSGTPVGCEDCYVPLLITAESLEEIASEKTKTDCALITTYERDSIWHNEGLVSVAPTDIGKPQRMLLLRGRKYRYQEIRAAEVLKLLQNPLGTIPISRPQLPRGPSGPSIEALVLQLRNVN